MKIRFLFMCSVLFVFAGGWISGHKIFPTDPGGLNLSIAYQPTPPPHGLPEIRLNASDYQPHDFYGYALDVDGSHLVAGAPGKDEAGQDAGGVYVFEQRGSDWIETTRLVPESLGANDRLGTTVAVDGETIAAGAPYAITQEGGFAAGSVYVFVHEEGWLEQTRLSARDGNPFDLFGSAIALDGDTLVIGAPSADDPGKGRNVGAAYVFHRENEAWVEQARLYSPEGRADDFFGRSLTLHGNVIAVGAFGHDDPETGPNTGAVYLFQRQEGAWFFQAKLTSSEPVPKAQFGFSLDFAGTDAEPAWLAVGANQYASAPVDPRYEISPGRVELFRWQNQSWQAVTQLSPEAVGEMETGLLGGAITMDILDTDHFALAAGSQVGPSIRLFRGRDGNWEQAFVIQSEVYQMAFGKVVIISSPYLVVGSPWEAKRFPEEKYFREVPQTGAVYIYDLSELK